MYEPIENEEQAEAAFKHAEARIAEARSVLAIISPNTPEVARKAIVSTVSITASRCRDVPAPGEIGGGYRGA